MFWRKRSAHGDDGLRESFSRPVSSLRTRYSLATAAFLLLGLACCYVGGRFVLSDLVLDAGIEFRQIGDRLSKVVRRHDERVAKELLSFVDSVRVQINDGRLRLTDIVADESSRASKDPLRISLAVRLASDGSMGEGVCWGADGRFALSRWDMIPYESVFTRWRALLAASARKPPLGLVTFGGVSHYVVMTALRDGGYLLAGRRFEESLFLADVRRNLPGLEASICRLPSRPVISRNGGGAESPLRLLDSRLRNDRSNEQLTFAMVDLLGSPVSIVSVTPPRTYSTIAIIAVGRYSVLIALVGILMAGPIFWLQGRLLLDPLSRMTRAVTALVNRRSDTDCPRIEWRGRDEFAQLAAAVNRMLETISARTVTVANLERRHRALINGFPDAIAVFDVRGRLVTITKEAEGVDPLPGFVVGDQLDGAVYGYPEVDRFTTCVAETSSSGQIRQTRLAVQRPKGVPEEFLTRHFEIRLTRMDEHFVLAIVRDVSREVAEHELRLDAERKVQDARKRESLTVLAAGIAHDMNNVLSIVLNAAEADGADPSGDSAGTLGTIRDAVRRGTSMMRELQTFAGENRMVFLRTSPNLLVGDALQIVSRVVGPNIVLSSDVTPGVPDVDVDVNQFWKVLFNIVKNASEAIGARPGKIELLVRPFEMTESAAAAFVSEHALPAGKGVLFMVKDDGDGIPPEILGRLFDPYVSSKALGRGLGLATVRTIVEAHSGGIYAECPPQGGTIFRVYLPASRDQRAVAADSVESATPTSAFGGADVLVVDNDAALLKTTSILLKAMKLRPHLAQGRREALGVVRRHAQDLKAILLDAHIGGIDTVRLLGAFRVGAPGVPVVVVSGSAEDELRELFAPHPYDVFLSKPYTMSELRQALATAGKSRK